MVILIVSMIAVIIIIFIVLVSLMHKIFNREVVTATAHLDSLSSEYAKKEEAIKKQFEDAKRQSQEILENAQKDGQKQKEDILKSAEDEKGKIINEAHEKAAELIRQADNARLALLAELNEKIEDTAIVKAAELLQAALPEDIRNDVHLRWVDDLIANSFEQLDRLKIPQGLNEVKVVSAFSLSQKQKTQLAAKLEEKLGYAIKLLEEVDPQIIAGLVVSIGSLFLDGSLKFKIQEVARGAKQ
jgi:F0F1-type ATP synthase membrane subunit b/b'